MTQPETLDPGYIWTVAFLRAGMSTERRALLKLFAERVPAVLYWPMESQLVERGRGKDRHKEVVNRPLYGGYALVQLPRKNTPFMSLLSPEARAMGFVELVRGQTGYPAQVAPTVVATLMEQESAGKFQRFKMKNGKPVSEEDGWLFPGALVRVKFEHYWLGGMLGVVETSPQRKRVEVLLNRYKDKQAIELGVEDLEPLVA